MSGDKLLIQVNAFAPSQTGKSFNAGSLITNDLLSNLVAGITGTGVSKASQSDLQSSSQLPAALSLFFPSHNSASPTQPKAYLNCVFLDDQFKYVSSNTQQYVNLGSVATLQLNPIPISSSKNGYAYIFLSNESSYDVYFDNLVASDIHGSLLEEDHYYPHGLTMSGISSRAVGFGIENKYRFNSKELQSGELSGASLNWYDFGSRNYDPQIGRWMNVDPSGSKFPQWSPYSAMANNPVLFLDADGKEPIPAYRRFFGEPRKAWQWYRSFGVNDVETFNSAAVYSTNHNLSSAYENISQRSDYYSWADEHLSQKSRWFGAAAIVTSWNAVGAAEGLNAWYLDEPAEKFLSAGNKYLFGFNMANAKSLLNTGGISGSFTDANGTSVSFKGLNGKKLDYALVQFEQTKVQAFISEYGNNNPNVDLNTVMQTINNSFDATFAPSEIKQVIHNYFNTEKGQKSFDFSNYNDRVKLGQKLVDLLYQQQGN